MAKEVDLLSYWMPVLRQIKEFKEIAKAEEPEIRALLEACDRTLSNFFISTADEHGISRFEKLVGIFPAEGADLETRRFNVQVKWDSRVSYTDAELYNRLTSLCGDGKFSIDPHYEDYLIDITTEIGVKDAFDTVITIIKDILPCNLLLTIKNLIKELCTTHVYAGGAVSTAMSYQITNDINEEYLSNGVITAGAGLSEGGAHTINDN